VKILSSGYSAEYGRTSALRSSSTFVPEAARITGSLFEYNREQRAGGAKLADNARGTKAAF